MSCNYQVDDLHASLNSKARDVKDLRNALTMTNATGMELVCVTAETLDILLLKLLITLR